MAAVSRMALDQIRSLLGNRNRRRVRVSGDLERNDRSVNHAQAFDATRAQSIIDDGRRVISHLACPDRVIERLGGLADVFGKVVVGLRDLARPPLFAAKPVEMTRAENLAREFDSLDAGGKIGLRSQIVGLNRRRGERILRFQSDVASALGLLQRDADREAVQVGIPEAVVHVKDRREEKLDVRRASMRTHFEKSGGLAYARCEWAFFEEHIVENVFDVVGSVQSYRFEAFVFDSDQQVIHQVLADAGQVDDNGDVHRAQMIGGADARKHQRLQRIYRPARQDDFTIDARLLGTPVLNELDADDPIFVEEQSRDVGAGLDPQVRARQDRLEKSGGGAVAFAVLLGDLKIAYAFLRRAVEISVVFQPGVLRCLDEVVSQRIDAAQVGDVQFAAHAVKFARPAFVVLGFFVIRQDVVVAPAFDAKLAEAVVVAAIGPAVDHRVDRARPAEHATARPEHTASVHVFEFFGFVGPVAFGLEELRESGGDLNLLLLVRAAGFEKQDFNVRVFGQTVGERAAGRAGADDVVIRRWINHYLSSIAMRSLWPKLRL